MPQYKLTYFDARGVTEPIRLLFAYSGVPYEDVRIPAGGLTAEKKQELELEWGQLPMLEIDGKKANQSWAIARLLAERFGLAGKDEAEKFRCDQIVEAVRDYFLKGYPLFALYFGYDRTKLQFKEQLKKFEVDSQVYLKRFNKILEEKGNTWIVGDSITYADMYMEHLITHYEIVFGIHLTDDFPALLKLISSVRTHPKLAKWYRERPKTPF